MQCPKCGYPLCEDCAAALSSLHSSEECATLGGAERPGPLDPLEDCPAYSAITPLRLLLLSPGHPVISILMDHNDERAKRDSPAWAVHELLVTTFIQGMDTNINRFS